MEFYNYHRFHQTLNYKRPMEVYDNERYLNYVKQNKTNNMANNITMLQEIA